MITFFNDRVEITSFSSLAPNQTIEGFFKGDSKPVNEDLSIIFLATHLSERSGKGVPYIVSKYGRNAFTFEENAIKVTLPYNWEYNYEPIQINSVENIINKLKENELKVFYAIKNNKNLSQIKIANMVGLGKTTVQTIINKLKKINVIEYVGSNKTGYWKIKELN